MTVRYCEGERVRGNSLLDLAEFHTIQVLCGVGIESFNVGADFVVGDVGCSAIYTDTR